MGSWGTVILQDLSGSSVAHALLACSFIGAHLQTDHILAGLQLLGTKIPLVFLCFSANRME